MSNPHPPRPAPGRATPLGVSLGVSLGVRSGVLLCALLGAPLGCGPRRAPARGPAPGDPAPRGSAAAGADTASVAIGGGKTIERLFAGRFPGVSVTPASNGGLAIRIRGGATSFTGGDEPLYIVDGTPLPQNTGGVVYLNPYDIEKIEVLKNPADVGVYGARGANGVVRITTTRPRRR